MEQFSHVKLYVIFSYFVFCIKNKYQLHTTYPKREVPLKALKKSLFWEHPNFGNLSQWRIHWGCRGISFVLDLSDQMFTLLFCMILLFVCLFMFVEILYNILLYVLFVKSFP